MANLKYTYALDSTRTRLVHIDDAIKGDDYYCPYSECGERLYIKDGGNRTKHFSHYSNSEKCSYDNYLHSLAERRIAEWFNSGNELTLQIRVKDYCQNYDKCFWRNDPFKEYTCAAHNFRSISLNHYYDKIEIEKHNRGYIWDLWFSNTNNPQLTSIAIEIFVTHKCEEDKLKSNVKIIEIRIESEEQLESIINSHTLIEGNNIMLHNFHMESQFTKTQGKKLNKFRLYENMKAFNDSYDTDCNSYVNRKNSSIFELTYLDNDLDYKYEEGLNPFSFGCVIAHKKFPNFRNCCLCKFYKYNSYYNQSICILYKSLMLEDMHNPVQAITCSKFSVNDKLFKECINRLSELSYNIWLKGDDNKGRYFKNNKLVQI